MHKFTGFICIILLTLSPAIAQFKNENLLFRAPKNYHQGFSDRQGNAFIAEFVPTGETVDNWTEMVTVNIQFGGLKAPIETYYKLMTTGWAKACDNADSQLIRQGTENGYPFFFWISQCPHTAATGKPEVTFFKAMQGNDSFYSVQKAWHYEPEAAEITKWTKFFTAVRICDTRIADRSCPS